MSVIITNIQRFCLHDGPGIRTTVFLKGCNLKCPWCSNPENISFDIQEYNHNGYRGIYGKEISLDELENEILKDLNYYKTGGGVTFSGGEALLQFDKLEPLLINLKEKKINICVETALTVPEKYIDIALKYVDEFIIDIKIIDERNDYKINGNSKLFLSNIKNIFNSKMNIVFRMPIVPKYTYTDENISRILKVLKDYKPDCVEIFKIHNLGKSKYDSLSLPYFNFDEISDEKMTELCFKIKSLGVNCKYIKL